MSAREFQAGDAAVAKHPITGESVRGFIDTDGAFYTTDQSCKGLSSSTFARSNLRPLIVIDPEDRKQVEGIRDEYDRQIIVQNDDPRPQDVTPGQRGNALQAALRSLIEPPKPPEPQGLGAVVRLVGGDTLVRTATTGRDVVANWCDKYGDFYRWDDLEVESVLSEGVS